LVRGATRTIGRELLRERARLQSCRTKLSLTTGFSPCQPRKPHTVRSFSAPVRNPALVAVNEQKPGAISATIWQMQFNAGHPAATTLKLARD
jgi:hypothetical protein